MRDQGNIGARRIAAALLVIASAAATGRAGETDRNAVAPRNEWCCEDGAAARTRTTLTPVIDGPVEVAWEYAPKTGTIVGSPIVFQSWACLQVSTPAGRSLVFVDVFDGSVIGEVAFRGVVADLLPSQAGGTLVARTGPSEWRSFSVRDGKVVRSPERPALAPIQALLAVWTEDVGAAVLLCGPDRLALCDADVAHERWSRRLEAQCRGELSARADAAYFVAEDARGTRVVTYTFDQGAPGSSSGLGYLERLGEPDFRAARVCVARGALVVEDVRVPAFATTRNRLTYLLPYAAPGDMRRFREPGLVTGPGRFAETGATWLAVLQADDGRDLQLCRALDDGRFRVLAHGAEGGFLSEFDRPVVAGGTTLLGRHAAAGPDLTIAWTAPIAPGARVVPARARALYAYDDRVIALRTRAPDGPRVRLVGAAAAPFAGAVVTERGDILEGQVTIDAAARTVVVARAKPLPLDAASLVLDANGGVVALASGAAAEEAILTLTRARRGAAVADLAYQAGLARSRELTTQLLAHATALGAPAAQLQRAASKSAGLEKLRELRPDNAAAEKVRVRAAPLLADDRSALTDLYRGLPKDADTELRLEVLRLLLRSPDAATELRDDVAALLPESLRPKGEFDPAAWIEVADAVRSARVELVPPPVADTPELTPGERTLGAMRHAWRDDLVGVRSEQILVLAPLETPGGLGRCLALGELVCSKLEETFREGTRNRASRYPITVVVYPTEDAYRERARQRGLASHVAENSAGHYSPTEELSHMYLPDDADAFRAVLPVFVHELTHQWVAERCPMFGGSARKDVESGGHWIVEGFAEMVAERAFDVRTRTWQFDPYAGSIAAVATLSGSRSLIPWERMFATSYVTFAQLSTENVIRFPGGRDIGRGGVGSETHLYYAQAAALAHYLFEAEEGRLRPKLLTYLAGFYTGAAPDPKAHFGMTPAELGRKVEAWARSLALR